MGILFGGVGRAVPVPMPAVLLVFGIIVWPVPAACVDCAAASPVGVALSLLVM